MTIPSAFKFNNTITNDNVAIEYALQKVGVSIAHYTPQMFGAVGGGVIDDSAALNALFEAVRQDIENLDDNTTIKDVDLSGTYACGNVNATGLVAFNLHIHGGRIISNTPNKPIFDLCGSRGYSMKDMLFIGGMSELVRPTSALQIARTMESEFCDCCMYDNLTLLGHYSISPIISYGQESSTHIHCRYWNYSHDARSAIFQGYSTFPVTSDYETVVTGGVSFIDNKYIDLDIRYLPIDNVLAIGNISQSNPVTITFTKGNTIFANGDSVCVTLVSGMTQINNVVATVSNAGSNSIQLTGINSTAFSAYTGGGQVIRQATVGCIYFGRGEGQNFDTCYAVTYGQSAIQLDFPDVSRLIMNNLKFDFLIEGAGIPSLYTFTPGAVNACIINGLEVRSYNTHAITSFFNNNASGTGSLTINGGDIFVANHSDLATLPFLNDYSKITFQGVNTRYPNNFIPSVTVAKYTGSIFITNLGYVTYFNSHALP